MGWVYFHNTGEFLGELPSKDHAKTDYQNLVIRRKAMVNQIENSHPGTFENVHNNYDLGE